MTCYVDAPRSYPDAGLRFSDYCHLLADTRAELHDIAGRLGLPRRIFQDHPWRWHYDLPAELRDEAIALGARPVSMREVATLLRTHRSTRGQCPVPEVDDENAAGEDPGATRGEHTWDTGH